MSPGFGCVMYFPVFTSLFPFTVLEGFVLISVGFVETEKFKSVVIQYIPS